MSIPGHGSPLDPSHCDLCRDYHTDPRYRQLVDGLGGDGTAASQLPRCVNLGDRLLQAQIAVIGLDVRRTWNRCTAGMGRPRGIVSPCLSCSSACKGYVALKGESAE